MTREPAGRPEHPRLNNRDMDAIKEVLRHLILIFWSQGGKKDWLSIVAGSYETWQSLGKLPGMDNPEIVASIRELREKYTPEELEKELESEFVRIFVNTKGGISAPLYHSCYHDEQNLLMKEPALEMSRMLDQAGIDLGSDVGEPPDHLCIELEYLFFLISHFRVHNDPQLWEHIRLFSRDFMLPWLDIFQKKIPQHEPASFFAHSALAMNRLVRFLGG